MTEKENESLIDLFKEINKKLIKNLKKFTESLNLHHGELPILIKLIRGEEGVRQKKILKKYPISKSTLSKTINDLV
ncbi:MAG: hypothetical protein ABEI78_01800, partial [Candidatus Nanohaloarchaea archaeon]